MATNRKKIKRIKKETYQTEEQTEFKRFIKILIIVIILVLGVYLFTRIFVTKDLFNNHSEVSVKTGEINYSKTLIGSMLNKPEEEYYVIIYNTEEINSIYYNGIISNYSQNTEALKVYIADLDNELNKKYIDKDNINVNVSNLEEFKVGDLALVKISKGKIKKILITEEDIAKELENIKTEAKDTIK